MYLNGYQSHKTFHHALFGDERKDTACHHGNQYQFAHTHDSCGQTSCPFHKRVTSIGYTHNTCQHIAHQQYQHHIHTHRSTYQHGCVRNNLPPHHVACRHFVCTTTHQQVDDTYQNGYGQHEEEVISKLIALFAPLRLRGYDSGIGYETEVITKECTTHNSCSHQW